MASQDDRVLQELEERIYKKNIFHKLAYRQLNNTGLTCTTCLALFSFCVVLAVLTYESTPQYQQRTWYASGYELDKWDSASLAIEAAWDSMTVPVQTQQSSLVSITLMYWKGDNIITPEQISHMYEIEQNYFSDPEYLARICKVQVESDTCDPHSQLSLLDDLNGLSSGALMDYLENNLTANDLWHFEKNFNSTKTSRYYQSYFEVGLPFPRTMNGNISDYKNNLDDILGQGDKIKDWVLPLWRNNQNKHGFTHYAVNGRVWMHFYTDEVAKSQALIYFSIIFLMGYLTFHLQSLFLAVCGTFIILLSFPSAWIIYRYVFQITAFDTINTVIIFVLLGIGADDMFVINDAYNQSKNLNFSGSKQEITSKQVQYAVSRSGRATMLTSLTTGVAFYCTSVSQLMPLRGFGVWAGTVILVNYLDFIILFPCLIIYQERYPWLQCECLFSYFKKTKENEEDEFEEDLKAQPKYRFLEVFFKDYFSPFIERAHHFLHLVAIIIISLGIFGVLQLEAPPEEEEYTSKDADPGQINLAGKEFYVSPESDVIAVQIFWGVQETPDQSDIDTWDATDMGSVRWDGEFDISSSQAQLHLAQVCSDLKSNEELVYNEEYVRCFIDDYMNYESGMDFPYVWSTDPAIQRNMFEESLYNFTFDNAYYSKYGLMHDMGFDEDRNLKYVRFDAKTNVKYGSARRITEPSRDLWETFKDDSNARAGTGYNKAFQTSIGGQWAWIDSQYALERGAITGLTLAIIFAFLCLLVFTQNWILSLLGIITVIEILLAICFYVWCMGWYFGVVESFTVVIIIGFSVDYVVHVGHAYLEMENLITRKERMQYALLTMGISVTSGALTTFLCGCPLIFSKVMVFKKMGFLIIGTVSFAIFSTLFLFSSLILDLGPTGVAGDLKHLCDSCCQTTSKAQDRELEMPKKIPTQCA